MIKRKLLLYKKAERLYRIKLAAAATATPDLHGQPFTPNFSNMPNAAAAVAQSPWYKVNWMMPDGVTPNGWAWLGAISGAIPMAAVGYNAGNGFAKWMKWNRNGLAARASRLIGMGLGGLAGAYIGKYGMLPIQASGRVSQALGGGPLGTIAGFGTAIGGSMAYTSAANKLVGDAGKFATDTVNYTPLSHDDASERFSKLSLA